MLRIIPRLDIKGPNLIKSISFEGLRVLGDPAEFAYKYYENGADELLFVDTVASLYQRQQFLDLINRVATKVFIPMIVCGGVRSLDDMESMLRNGADKIGMNTAAVANPGLVTQGAKVFGKQCMVLSIEAKKVGFEKWECYTDNGRERTGVDAVQWAIRGEGLGAGEILVTSVDKDGTRSGFDEDLIINMRKSVSVPVIASGGAGKPVDVTHLSKNARPSGICIASMLHYGVSEIGSLKNALADEGLKVRRVIKGKP